MAATALHRIEIELHLKGICCHRQQQINITAIAIAIFALEASILIKMKGKAALSR